MSIKHKNIAQSLNLFGASSLCSLISAPVGASNYAAGGGVFVLGMACNVAAAMLLLKDNEGKTILSPQAQFASAASATAMGVVSMGGAAILSISDIIHNSSVSFTSMGAGFAMATGMVSFYGGLRGLQERQDDPKVVDRTVSGP